MAQRVNITLVCDFCGAGWDVGDGDPDQPATESFETAINGPTYTVDLCDKHAAGMFEIRDLVQRVGRTERRGPRRDKPRPFKPDTVDVKRARTQQLREVRAWAAENGFGDVGNARVPYRVQRAFNDANPDKALPLADGGRGTSRRAEELAGRVLPGTGFEG